MLDSTVVTTALPTMAADLGADPVRLNIAITSYLLAVAVFVPISGWAADRYGARRVFIAAIAVKLPDTAGFVAHCAGHRRGDDGARWAHYFAAHDS